MRWRAFRALVLLGLPWAAWATPPPVLVERVLASTPLIDGHNDWAWAMRTALGLEQAKSADLYADPSARRPPGHTSIPWLRQGRVGGQIWSVYVPATLPPVEAVRTTFEQIELVRHWIRREPRTFELATTAAEVERAFRRGRIASLLGIEGAHQVADDIAILRRAHALGVRAMTLAHSRPTNLFDSATADPRHGGMAPGGLAMIAEMNRLGVLVDLSHVSPQVMHQVLDVAQAPVIFSHSSARALVNHPRNVPDDVLKRLKDNGGLVMVTFVPAFVSQARADWEARRTAQRLVAGQGAEAERRMAEWERANPRPEATLAQVADHIEHVARVAGYDHVGLGGDFDGVPDLPKGLETVATYPALFAELARRGWSEAQLRKLAGENFLRVLRAAEATARRLQAASAGGTEAGRP
ncbi:MAG: dipeptidase [Sphingomonadaceae bacterium]|uniref:dipeptidase n=1 Tax=Thermaurantiacus sp. TaxID=2820283 RepID=UPI00298EF054|nr:dipeptidase [Thermaurantiacus sp.]MCS6987297.1 dipeptidase [Sphingomonadaceae bacterium]MDW8414517.1 dipeptidase [Thermaurantiacus sp.]